MCSRMPHTLPPCHVFRILGRHAVPVLHRGRTRPSQCSHSCVNECSCIRQSVCGHRAPLGAGAQRPSYFESLRYFPSIPAHLSGAKSFLGFLCVCLPFLHKNDWTPDIPAMCPTWILGNRTQGFTLALQVLFLSEHLPCPSLRPWVVQRQKDNRATKRISTRKAHPQTAKSHPVICLSRDRARSLLPRATYIRAGLVPQPANVRS